MASTYGLNFIKYLNFLVCVCVGGGGGGQQKPPIRRGLHLTCDAHFRTRISYSSQKSCVKIWFRLVEIGMLIFSVGKGGQKPPIKGGYL